MTGSLPPALVAVALGLALAFANRRSMLVAGVAFAAAALAAAVARPDPAWREGALLGAWATIVIVSATVHLPRRPGPIAWAVLAAVAGLWAGQLIALSGQPLAPLKVAPWLLLCLPGSWLVRTGRGIAIKVLSSWLIAVAVLAAALSTVPLAGYEMDHRE